jgi:hypothetical protein
MVLNPRVSTPVLRATLHRRDTLTSTFSNGRSGYPQVSRAFFSNAYQLWVQFPWSDARGLGRGRNDVVEVAGFVYTPAFLSEMETPVALPIAVLAQSP